MGLILIDKSAWVRADPAEIERYGEPCLCAITRLEILSSASSTADYAEQQAALALFRDLRVDAQTMAAAESAQHELATRGQHRISLPDLIIGAWAQQHTADACISIAISKRSPTCSAFGRCDFPELRPDMLGRNGRRRAAARARGTTGHPLTQVGDDPKGSYTNCGRGFAIPSTRTQTLNSGGRRAARYGRRPRGRS